MCHRHVSAAYPSAEHTPISSVLNMLTAAGILCLRCKWKRPRALSKAEPSNESEALAPMRVTEVMKIHSKSSGGHTRL